MEQGAPLQQPLAFMRAYLQALPVAAAGLLFSWVLGVLTSIA